MWLKCPHVQNLYQCGYSDVEQNKYKISTGTVNDCFLFWDQKFAYLVWSSRSEIRHLSMVVASDNLPSVKMNCVGSFSSVSEELQEGFHRPTLTFHLQYVYIKKTDDYLFILFSCTCIEQKYCVVQEKMTRTCWVLDLVSTSGQNWCGNMFSGNSLVALLQVSSFQSDIQVITNDNGRVQ